jgi:hypothetical protein
VEEGRTIVVGYGEEDWHGLIGGLDINYNRLNISRLFLSTTIVDKGDIISIHRHQLSWRGYQVIYNINGSVKRMTLGSFYGSWETLVRKHSKLTKALYDFRYIDFQRYKECPEGVNLLLRV